MNRIYLHFVKQLLQVQYAKMVMIYTSLVSIFYT